MAQPLPPTPVAVTKTAPHSANVTAAAAASRTSGSVDAAAPPHLQSGRVHGSFDAMLNQTDLKSNKNKFIRVQLVSTGAGVTLHKRWGRVGEAGQQQQVGPLDEAGAEKEFRKYFRSKTGNAWGDDFVPKNGKYTLIDMESDTDRAQRQRDDVRNVAPPQRGDVQCSLEARTKAFVELIFDQDMFRSAMADLEIDPARLPLGALSKSQIQRGRDVLERLEAALEGKSNEDLDALSGEFYTEIPHSFGRRRPPAIRSFDALKVKYDVLNVLDDIQVAQDATTRTETTTKHPTDVNYEALKVDLTPVTDAGELQIIQTYFQATSQRGTTLEHVFRVKRHDDHFTPLSNHQLLWHGTRVAVVAAILKSGLRIMPHSGGRVGRGIYLADVHEKSASYAGAGRGKIVMFLVEAALGTTHDITRDHPHLVAPPPGSHSVVARGRQEPDPRRRAFFNFDGTQVSVPQGQPLPNPAFADSSFHHNEFLIYSEAQHRIRYVLQFGMSTRGYD